jgi:hypothetical protein
MELFWSSRVCYFASHRKRRGNAAVIKNERLISRSDGARVPGVRAPDKGTIEYETIENSLVFYRHRPA